MAQQRAGLEAAQEALDRRARGVEAARAALEAERTALHRAWAAHEDDILASPRRCHAAAKVSRTSL